MGFNKRYVQPKHALQQMVFDHGVEYVVDFYKSADVLIGDADALDYLHGLQVIVYNNIKDPKFKNDLSK
jgi:hypothetical protein